MQGCKEIKKRIFFLVALLPCFLASLLPCFPLHAKPYIPKDNFVILEKTSTKELQKLKNELSKNPYNQEKTIGIAKSYIDLGRSKNDPRYFSYALALLNKIPKTSTEAQTLLAIIHQHNHDFDLATSELNEVLKRDSNNYQAWLTKATILQTLGKYNEAKKSCIPLLTLTNELVSNTCISSVSSLNGDANKSYNLLKTTIERAGNTISKNEKVWSLTTLAEIARRLEDYSSSEKHYKEALSIEPNEGYLLSSYSDFLLSQNRASEVINLLKEKTKIDGLLLRITIAEKSAKAPSYKTHLKELKARFKANRLRGDNIHLREEAIFYLKLLGTSQKAIELAKQNWQIQKEPIDLQILLESAIAVNDKKAAKTAVDFVTKNKLEDKEIEKLITKLKEM